jgi:hypothetical protein
MIHSVRRVACCLCSFFSKLVTKRGIIAYEKKSLICILITTLFYSFTSTMHTRDMSYLFLVVKAITHIRKIFSSSSWLVNIVKVLLEETSIYSSSRFFYKTIEEKQRIREKRERKREKCRWYKWTECFSISIISRLRTPFHSTNHKVLF